MAGKESSGVSRRQFLKGSGIFAGAAFIGAGLVGCAEEKAPGTSATEGSTGKGEGATTLSYQVYDADVLVIGTGFGGIAAAFEANAKGAKVVMVDKGPFEFSGAAGMNWDQEVVWPDAAPASHEMVAFNDLFANQKLVKNAFDFMGQDVESWNALLWWVRMGDTTWNRLKDGSLENLLAVGDGGAESGGGGGMNLAQRGFSRHIQDTLSTAGIPIIDNTMITDVFLSDGTCVGAIGYHVHTGEYRVFRAKATVSANGAGCQMYGWLETHPISMNTPDNTGDIDAAAYRHGVSLISNEFFGVDLISVDPASLGASFNAGLGADGNHMQYVCDKDGNFFMRETNAYDVSRPIRDCILDGKGGPHEGVFLDLTDPDALERTNMRPCYSRNVQLWKEKFGLDVTQPGYKIPIKLEAFEHGGAFVIDENCMASIPGLFGTRGYGLVKGHIVQQTYIGAYAGFKAYEYAMQTEVANVDWTAAEAEISRLDEIRTKDAADGIRPEIIRHAIQNTFYAAWEPASDATKLQTALDEIERIKKEDLPKQVVADKSRVFNRDWREAIENYNVIDMTEASLRSALMREESRLTFYRTDFPEADDANWRANIECRLNGDTMELSKVEQVLV